MRINGIQGPNLIQFVHPCRLFSRSQFLFGICVYLCLRGEISLFQAAGLERAGAESASVSGLSTDGRTTQAQRSNPAAQVSAPYR